jgi:hypothetical protein
MGVMVCGKRSANVLDCWMSVDRQRTVCAILSEKDELTIQPIINNFLVSTEGLTHFFGVYFFTEKSNVLP